MGLHACGCLFFHRSYLFLWYWKPRSFLRQKPIRPDVLDCTTFHSCRSLSFSQYNRKFSSVELSISISVSLVPWEQVFYETKFGSLWVVCRKHFIAAAKNHGGRFLTTERNKNRRAFWVCRMSCLYLRRWHNYGLVHYCYAFLSLLFRTVFLEFQQGLNSKKFP